MNIFSHDFGYSWPWNYGHLILAALFGILTLLSWKRRWPHWMRILAPLASIWACAGFLVVQYALRLNLPLELHNPFLCGERRTPVLPERQSSRLRLVAYCV